MKTCCVAFIVFLCLPTCRDGRLEAAPPAPVAPSPIPGRTADEAFSLPPEGLTLHGQADVRYGHAALSGASQGAFDVGRAELGLVWQLGGDARPVTFALQLDAIRSAGVDSVFGVDGNAIVPALSRAWVGWAPLRGDALAISARLGVIPDPALESLELGYRLRSLAPMALEAMGLVARNDLGAVVDLSTLGHHVSLRLAAVNGEGARQVELDPRKTLMAQLGAHLPLTVLGQRGRLDAVVGYRSGTLGPASGRADRLHAGLVWDHPVFSGGLEGALADGVAGRPDRRAATLGAWFAGHLGDFGLSLRGDLRDLDRDSADAGAWALAGAVSFDLLARQVAPVPSAPRQRLRAWLGFRAERFGAGAAPLGLAAAADSDAIFFALEAVAWDTNRPGRGVGPAVTPQ